jgi:hypothetical protein
MTEQVAVTHRMYQCLTYVGEYYSRKKALAEQIGSSSWPAWDAVNRCLYMNLMMKCDLGPLWNEDLVVLNWWGLEAQRMIANGDAVDKGIRGWLVTLDDEKHALSHGATLALEKLNWLLRSLECPDCTLDDFLRA